MNLIIDLGNSNVKIAVYDGEEMIDFVRQPKHYILDIIRKCLIDYPINKAIVSHTSDLSNNVFEALKGLDLVLDFSWETPIPIRLDYTSLSTLGRDRIAGAVACYKMYPNQRSIFVDMGTCITKNVVNEEGIFLGGNISPGIDMRLKSMHTFTSRLPKVEAKAPENVIGKSTEEALQNGAVRGSIDEIEHFILREKEQFGRINVILTGGNADFFVNLSNIKIFVAPFLVLTGLNEILNYNANKK